MKLFFRYTVVNEDGTYYKHTYINPFASIAVLGIMIAVWYVYGRDIIDFIFKLIGV